MSITKLLQESLTIIWHKKSLLLFGFLAASSINNIDMSGFRYNLVYPFSTDVMPAEMLRQISQFWSENILLLTIFALISLFFAVILWTLHLTAQASMFSLVEKIKLNEKTNFQTACAIGLSKLNRILRVSLVMYGPFLLLGLLILGAVMAQAWKLINAAASSFSPAEMENVIN